MSKRSNNEVQLETQVRNAQLAIQERYEELIFAIEEINRNRYDMNVILDKSENKQLLVPSRRLPEFEGEDSEYKATCFRQECRCGCQARNYSAYCCIGCEEQHTIK